MPRNCTINFNNPVTGRRHQSLVAYMLNQNGIAEEDLKDVLDAGFIYRKSSGVKYWNDKKSQSPYVEPNVKEVLKSLDVEVDETTLNYISQVQEFYDSQNLSIDTNLNLSQVKQVLRNLVDTKIALELEAVDPSVNIQERTYRLYPVPYSSNSVAELGNAFFNETYDLQIEMGTPNALQLASKYIDLINPNIYNTINKIIQDPTTTQEQKDILNTLLSITQFAPNIHFNITRDLIPTEENDSYVPGMYNSLDNTIYFNAAALSQLTPEKLKKLVIHEMVHAAFYSVLENPITVEEKVFAGEIKRIHQYYRNKYEGKRAADDFYGLYDYHEFLSEFLSNPKFRGILEQEAPEVHGSTIQSILNFFKKLYLSFANKRRSSAKENTPVPSVTEEYIDSLFNTMVTKILDDKTLNTSQVYVADKKLNSNASSLAYDQFLEELPYSDSDIFFERLNEFLNSDAVNWSQVYRDADKTGINSYNITTAQEYLNNILIDDISRTDLKTSFESLVKHLGETISFLRVVAKNLEEVNKNKTLSERDIFSRSFHAAQLGQFFEDYVKDFESFMFPGNETVPLNTLLGKSLNNIKLLSQSLKTSYENNAARSIAKRLADEIHPQTVDLQKNLEKEIKRLKNLEEKADSAAVRNNAKLRRKKEEERLKLIANPKNLEQALLGSLAVEESGGRQAAANYISSIFESAAISGNLVSAPIATLVNNIWSRSTQKALAFEGELKAISDKLEKYNKKKGKKAFSSLDYQKVFSPFVKKVKVFEIKRGQLVERETMALLSEFNEIEYWNDWTKKKYEINVLQSKKSRTEEEEAELQSMIDDLINFEDNNLQSMYTDEYYRIQNLLSPEAKEARQNIIDQMRKIQLSPIQGEQSEEDLDKLDDLKSQLDQLESDYDEYGVLKDEYDLNIAKSIKDWKAERAEAKIYSYVLSDKNRVMFDSIFESKKNAVNEAKNLLLEAQNSNNSENLQIAQRKYQKAIKELSNFKRANVVRKIDPKFYEERRDIIDAIAAIQQKYPANVSNRSVQEVYQELFTLLKPYKNKNGEYEGSLLIQEKLEYVNENNEKVSMSVPERVKQLQNEIDDIRNEISENKQISKQDREALKILYKQLGGLQDRVTTEDYDKEKAKHRAKIRAKVIASLEGNISDYTDNQINRKIETEFKKTTWYKDNHRLVYDYRLKKKVYEPTFQWMTTLPTNPDYILETEPSFRWYNIEVNPEFINPTVKENRFSKRVALKDNSPYRNKEYSKLDSEQKQILAEITDLYERQQKGLPKNLMKGLELPSVRKDGLEAINSKFGTISSQMKGLAGNLVDSILGRDDEDLATASAFGQEKKTDSQVNRYKNRLYMKYVQPISADQMSINFIDSIGQFGAESIRFKGMYEELPYLLGVRDLVDKNVRGTTAKVVNNLLERRMNGQNKVAMFNIGFLRGFEWAVDKSLSLGANMALSLNLPSSIKNFQAGSANIYSQLNRFGVSKKDVAKYMAKNSSKYFQLFNSEVEEGKNTPYMVKMKYFGVMTKDTLSDTGKKLYLTSLDRSAKFNPLKHLSFFREYGEFEMRSSVAEALSNKFLIELENGKFIPIMDAYETVGNSMIPREDIKDLANFGKVEQHFRNQLNLINSLIHGAYGSMDKAEYTRYTIGRLLMYMKGWAGYQYLSRFGSRRMSYSAGMEFEGMYRTVLNATGLLFKNKLNFSATGELLSNMEKENLFSAMLDTINVGAAMLLANLVGSMVYSDDDKELDNDLTYFMLFNLLYLEDELSSLHPLAGTHAIWHSRVENNVDGKNLAEYYFRRNVTLPFRGITSVLESIYDFTLGDINAFDDYVPRSSTGRVLNPKRYIRDPFLKGQPEIVARLSKLWALDKTVNYFIGGQEFLYRRYEYSNPKWYMSSYTSDKRSARKGAASAKREISSIERELSYVDDPSTQQSLRERIEYLKDVIKLSKEKEQSLRGEFENIDRR